MKFVLIVMLSLVAHVSFGLNLTVSKMRTINGQPAKGGDKIFSRQWSRHFYQISLVGANLKDCEGLWKIRVLPILKGCRGGCTFPFMKGVCEQNEIKVSQSRKWVCVYVSPLVIWTKDTWTDVGGDLSHGLVNSSIAVELIHVHDGKETVVRYWTNSPMSAYQKAKSFDDGSKNLRDGLISYVEEKIYEYIDDRELIEQPARIECLTWNEFKKRM